MGNRNRNSFKELTHLGMLKTCFDRAVNSNGRYFICVGLIEYERKMGSGEGGDEQL